MQAAKKPMIQVIQCCSRQFYSIYVFVGQEVIEVLRQAKRDRETPNIRHQK